MKVFVKKVMYSKPAVTVSWSDGSKTSATCGENDTYDKEKGLALCIVKKLIDDSIMNELFQEFAITEGCDKEVIENPFVKEMENLTRSIFENMKVFEKVSKQLERTGTYASSCNPNAGKKTTANSSNSRSNTRSCYVDLNVGKGKCCHIYIRTKNKPMAVVGGDSELNKKAWDRILDICSKRGKGQKGDPVVKLVFPDGYIEYYDVERGEILANKTIRDSGTCVFFLVENRVVASNCYWKREWYEYDEDHKFFEDHRDIDSFIDEFEKNLKKTRTVEELKLSFFGD